VLAALDRSDHRVLLATPESPTLTSLRELLDTLDLLAYERRTRSVVVNRAGSRTASHRPPSRRAEGAGGLLDPVQRRRPVSINRGIRSQQANPIIRSASPCGNSPPRACWPYSRGASSRQDRPDDTRR